MSLFGDRIRDIATSITKFLTKDIWNLDFSELSKAKARWLRYLQTLLLTLRGFTSGRIGREAVALSFFGTMSAIPLAAVILFLSRGFKLDQKLADMLYHSFPTSTQLIDVILGWADNIVVTTEKGAFGWISFLTFAWLVIWLMLNIELAFNRIWKVPKPRRMWRRMTVYLTILTLAPFVILLFLAGWAYYARFIGGLATKLGFFSFITKDIFWLVFYILAVFILSLMYKFIPYAYVRYGAALRSSFIAGVAFILVQYLYMGTQMMVTRLSAVYGAFAAIPLFMVWMNLSWQVILFGSELSYAYQQIDMAEIKERRRKQREHKRQRKRQDIVKQMITEG